LFISVVVGVVGAIHARRQGVAEAQILRNAEFVREVHDLLADLPYLLGDDARVAGDRQTVGVVRVEGARRQSGRQGQRGKIGAQRRGVAVVHQRVGRDVAAIPQERVLGRPSVAEFDVEVRPEVVHRRAAAVADVVVAEAAARARDLEILELLAVVGVVQLIEAGIGLRLAVHDDVGEVGIPLVLVAQVAVPEHQ
jgi:hypothetical protein